MIFYLIILHIRAWSKIFEYHWTRSKFFDLAHYFWPCSNIQNYKVKYHFWPCSKIFDQVQKILNKVKKVWTRSKNFWTSRWNRHNFSATYPDSVRKKFCWVIFIENIYLSMGPRRRVTSMAGTLFFNLFQTIWQIPIFDYELIPFGGPGLSKLFSRSLLPTVCKKSWFNEVSH